MFSFGKDDEIEIEEKNKPNSSSRCRPRYT
jgi:hypothetical protein